MDEGFQDDNVSNYELNRLIGRIDQAANREFSVNNRRNNRGRGDSSTLQEARKEFQLELKKLKDYIRDNFSSMKNHKFDDFSGKQCGVCCETFAAGFYKCACKVQICNECFTDWVKQLGKEQVQSIKLEWRCPQPKPAKLQNQPRNISVGQKELNQWRDRMKSILQPCNEFTFNALISMIQQFKNRPMNTIEENKQAEESINSLNECSLRHYIIQQNDVRQCPNDACQNAGFVEISNSTGIINCSNKLECEGCNAKWHDPLQWISTGTWYGDIYKSIAIASRGLSHNFKMLSSFEPCPNCQMWIQKNGGCQHMQCSKCKYEFCWHCLGHYAGYNHDDELTCPSATISRVTINIIMVLAVLLKFHSWNWVGLIIYWATLIIIADLIAVVSFLILIASSEDLFRRRGRNTTIFKHYTFYIVIAFIVLLWHLLGKVSFGIEMQQILMNELTFIVGGITSFFILAIPCIGMPFCAMGTIFFWIMYYVGGGFIISTLEFISFICKQLLRLLA